MPENDEKRIAVDMSKVEVVESSLAPFITLGLGSNQLMVSQFPKEAIKVKIKDQIREKLYIIVVDANKKLCTLSINYSKKVTTGSQLGQMLTIAKEHNIVTPEQWKGIVIDVIKQGTGRNVRYFMKFIKAFSEKEYDNFMKGVTTDKPAPAKSALFS